MVLPKLYGSQASEPIGVARILSGRGARFLDDLFLVVALKDRLNIPPNLTRPAKTVLKIDSYSGWGGALRVLGLHLHIFPVNYA